MPTIPELESKLKGTSDERTRIDLLNTLAWECRHNDPQRSRKVSETAYELAQQVEGEPYRPGIADSLFQRGFLNLRAGRFDCALQELLDASAAYETLQFSERHLDTLRYIGEIFRKTANYSEGLQYCLRGLKRAKQQASQPHIARFLTLLGALYADVRNIPESLAAYQKALRIFQEFGDTYFEGLVRNNLGMLYLQNEEYSAAIEQAEYSLKIALEIDNRTLQAYVLDTLGHIFLKKPEPQTALGYLRQSLDLCRTMGNHNIEPEILVNMAAAHLEQNQNDRAYTLLTEALTLAEQSNDKASVARCHHLLSQVYQHRNNFEQALRHYEDFHRTNGEVFNDDAEQRLKTLHVIHKTETARQEAEMYYLKNVALEQEIEERKRVEWQLNAAHSELQVKNAQLLELNASKDKFFSIISHDLRSPFTTLLGFTQLLEQRLEQFTIEEIGQQLSHICTAAERLYALLENLLTWSRLQRGAMQYQPEQIKIADILEENIDLFSQKAQYKNIQLFHNIEEPTDAYADYSMMNSVVRNLLSNALKFTPSGGHVTLSARPIEKGVEIVVKDTGCGIEPEGVDKLFRIDTQYTNPGTDGEKGSGLGLILCKELIERNHGEIVVDSGPDDGTTFTVSLPAVKCAA